jgi:benzoyl-CoA 2,3-dioxygenase component B
MHQDPNEDVTRLGGIPLDILQKYINEWFSAALDLFGSEDSSNAALYFAAGLKGRFREEEVWEDHRALEGNYVLEVPDASGQMRRVEIPLRRAMNQLLRDAFIADCERALGRWNRVLERAGITERLFLPSPRFNREVGVYAGYRFSPQGQLLSESEWQSRRDEFLPSERDRAYVQSLMTPVYEPGRFAPWIAPPARGINGKPLDFEYVRFHRQS